MKHAKMILAFIMVAALLGLSACSDQGTTDGQGQKPSAAKGTGMPSADDTPAEKTETSEISGVLEQNAAGIMLVSESGKYLVIGQDLTGMIGKTVTIKGAVEESGGQMKITVEEVTAAQ
ncbi:MAG: hypothetical protein WBV95_05235 [Desulfobacterales bacterium]